MFPFQRIHTYLPTSHPGRRRCTLELPTYPGVVIFCNVSVTGEKYEKFLYMRRENACSRGSSLSRTFPGARALFFSRAFSTMEPALYLNSSKAQFDAHLSNVHGIENNEAL